jgi:uncharacterized protein (TIGR03067 family)
MRRGVAAVLALAVLAGVARADDKKDPLAELRGTWTLVSYRVDGATLRGADEKSTFTVEEDRWTSTWRKDGGGEQIEQGAVKVIDAGGKPKVADLVHTFGVYKGTTTRVFYQIDGDFLRYTSVVAPETITPDGKVVTTTLTWKRKRDAR